VTKIGQIQALWAIVFLGQFCEKNRSSPKFRASFLPWQNIIIVTKSLAAFWAIFSYTLVTLFGFLSFVQTDYLA
jgi:hypothetical protein